MISLYSNEISGICNSGGAIGADIAWGNEAAACGYAVRHLLFAEHKIKPDVRPYAVVLDDEQLKLATPALNKANETLKRSVPPIHTYSGKLLARNFYQQVDASSLYIVTYLKDRRISGGSAWATQMFIDRSCAGPLPIFVFDQGTSLWYQWGGDEYGEMDALPPRPREIFAGIGTRDILPIGLEAISAVLRQEDPA
jgi:hypothetical protein